MTKNDLLVMLKANVEIITDYMDEEAKTAKDIELTQYIDAALAYITREGITFDAETYEDVDTGETITEYRDVSDCMLIVMYAAWLYEKRKESVSYGNEVSMPRMLRYNLNNRLFSEKIKNG